MSCIAEFRDRDARSDPWDDPWQDPWASLGSPSLRGLFIKRFQDRVAVVVIVRGLVVVGFVRD